MIYITGDTHGVFDHIAQFCQAHNTTKDDLLIILGDAGLNYYGNRRDVYKKMYVQELPITILCIHGNHEMRPETIPSYLFMNWRGGVVYYEEAFPSILFAKDGCVFDIDGLSVAVMGGAYSVDKEYRLSRGWGWWSDEQPSQESKDRFVAEMAKRDWNVDIVLSHTAPLTYEPTEVFLSFIDQATVDKSTEEFLDEIEDHLDYRLWYCGHYHTEKSIDRIRFLYHSILPFADTTESFLGDGK